MKIKAKYYREFYLACIKLYGIINSDNAFRIFKKYYPDALKSDFINDLKSRLLTFSRDYVIWKTTKRNTYMITSDITDEEEIDALVKLQADKPFYMPESYSDFLSAANYETWKKDNEKDVNKLINIIKRSKGNIDYIKAETIVMILYEDVRCMEHFEGYNPIEMILKRLALWDCEIKESLIDDFFNVLKVVLNDIRYPSNRGYTPNELCKMSGPINLNNLQMTIGPNMRKRFLSGELDIKEYLDGIISSDMPPSVKRSLIEELKEIKKDIDKTPKA